MRPSLRPLIPLTMALAFAATPAAVAQSPGPGDTPDPAITDGSAQRKLDDARARWQARKVPTYRIRVALGCFCPEDIRKPRTLTVRRAAPVRPPFHLKDVATVPRLFRTIQGAIDDGVARIDVRYGPRGIPQSIAIDVSERIADEERFYAIDRFTPLKR